MKFNKEDSSLEVNSNEKNTDDVSNGDLPVIERSTDVYHCPKCTTPMACFQDSSVQCELLTDTKTRPFFEIIDKIKNGIKQGSAQSVTEVMEEVPYNKSVVTVDESSVPDETVLITRSFENEAMTQESRRSSVAVILDAIKSLGARLTSEPVKTRSLEFDNTRRNENNESGHCSHSQTLLQPSALSGDNGQSMGKNAQRTSIQLDNGTVIEEETIEYDADKAISTNGDSVVGEVNFISRSFETVHESLPGRKESLIDKINPLKLIEKMRRGSQTQVQNNVHEDDLEENKYEPVVVCSGVRRKSLLPAVLTDSRIGEDKEGDRGEGNEIKAEGSGDANLETAVNSESFHKSPIRFVTTGLRRGSVAAVSAAPPCRDQAEDSRMKQACLPDNEINQDGVRFITDGVRKGSVAMVSATPPCHHEGTEKTTEGGSRINNMELCIDGEDYLRSGVRRRSLGLVTEGSQSAVTSPAREKRGPFETASENCTSTNDESEIERERESSDAADGFMNRVAERYIGKGPEMKKRKRGAINLFEELTGREIGVDYSSIDAKKIQEKLDAEFDEKHKIAPRLSIPVITFSEDKSEDEHLEDKKETAEVTDKEIADEAMRSEEEGAPLEYHQDLKDEMSQLSEDVTKDKTKQANKRERSEK